jgi:hypothetical protein
MICSAISRVRSLPQFQGEPQQLGISKTRKGSPDQQKMIFGLGIGVMPKWAHIGGVQNGVVKEGIRHNLTPSAKKAVGTTLFSFTPRVALSAETPAGRPTAQPVARCCGHPDRRRMPARHASRSRGSSLPPTLPSSAHPRRGAADGRQLR